MKTRHIVVFGLLLAVFALTTQATASSARANTTQPSIFAAVITWRGTAGDARWSNPANWEGGIVPGPGNIARFASGTADARVESPPGEYRGIRGNDRALSIHFSPIRHVSSFSSFRSKWHSPEV